MLVFFIAALSGQFSLDSVLGLGIGRPLSASSVRKMQTRVARPSPRTKTCGSLGGRQTIRSGAQVQVQVEPQVPQHRTTPYLPGRSRPGGQRVLVLGHATGPPPPSSCDACSTCSLSRSVRVRRRGLRSSSCIRGRPSRSQVNAASKKTATCARLKLRPRGLRSI